MQCYITKTPALVSTASKSKAYNLGSLIGISLFSLIFQIPPSLRDPRGSKTLALAQHLLQRIQYTVNTNLYMIMLTIQLIHIIISLNIYTYSLLSFFFLEVIHSTPRDGPLPK